MYKLASRGHHTANRILLFVFAFLFCTCTAHAAVYLADIIADFTSSTPALVHIADQGRPQSITELTLYIINCQIGDYFLTWRVYSFWRSKVIVAVLVVLSLVPLVIGCVATNLLSRQHTILVGSVRTWAVVAWVSSVIVQVCGSLLIGWRAWSTPTTVVANGRQGFNPWTIIWTLVDSGALYTITTVLVLALWFDYPGAFNVLVAILGQIAAFVPLTITLRECWKADHAPSNRGPSAGTFLVPVRESYSLQPTTHSRNNGGLPDGIMITTDQHSDGTLKKAEMYESDAGSPPSRYGVQV
ncbi:unnamed protein product [Peniophora sp. CBMAI 1063]|nr:unnamed protein product [Peniophora sp. CBMAI 1063]